MSLSLSDVCDSSQSVPVQRIPAAGQSGAPALPPGRHEGGRSESTVNNTT